MQTIGSMRVAEVERLEVQWRLWTPARIAAPRATCDVELHLRDQLGALAWHIFAPEPAGEVEQILADGLRWVVGRSVQL